MRVPGQNARKKERAARKRAKQPVGREGRSKLACPIKYTNSLRLLKCKTLRLLSHCGGCRAKAAGKSPQRRGESAPFWIWLLKPLFVECTVKLKYKNEVKTENAASQVTKRARLVRYGATLFLGPTIVPVRFLAAESFFISTRDVLSTE